VARIPSGLEKHLTSSIGLAEYDASTEKDMGAFVIMADRALYQAKEQGKNRICHAGKLPAEGKAAAVTPDERNALLNQ
jgi:PleD family two-component response regulator